MCVISVMVSWCHISSRTHQECPHVLFEVVNCEGVSFQSCLKDIDRCSSSNNILEIIPGLYCGCCAESITTHVNQCAVTIPANEDRLS